MTARPKLTCDEDELMEMQEAFRSGKLKNSLTSEVIKAPTAKSEEKKSIFAQRREMADKAKEHNFRFQLPKVQVLKDVVEKYEIQENKVQDLKRENPFPEVFQRTKSLKGSGSGSIFAQQLRKAKLAREEADEMPVIKLPPLNQSSIIAQAVLGETEAGKVHQENLQKLSSMTEEEILGEQQQLLQNLDPKLIALLKNKKQAASSFKQVVVEAKSQNETCAVAEDEPEVEEIQELKNSKWVHMDHVEKEKVRWMSSLPPIKEISGESFQARFDFQGHLLPPNVDLPVTSALHHHGEEPERAGYSINELMLLSRSSKMQQRVLALNTLANVLENASLGLYDSCFESPLIPTLLDNGLLTLLRFCMDDSTSSVVIASLVAFARLLSSPFDETCLERCYIWHGGEKQPNLCSRIEMDPTDQEQEPEMKDNEMIRVDVIKACLRMDVPWRIRYVLEEIRPEARAVVAALEILTRMARHSPAIAQSILDCPRLMDTIFRFFLPKDWASLNKSQDEAEGIDNVYGSPVRQVLRLARAIASWNAELATTLVTKYSLLESIKIYVAMDTIELKLPTQEALLLVLDCYHTWRTLLQQGIGIQSFLEFYPVWFPQLQYYQSSISMDSGTSNNSNARFSHHLGSSMLLLMEALLSTCCNSGSCSGNCSGNHKHLHIKEIGGLREAIEMCVAKWAWQLRELTVPVPDSAGCLLAAGIHVLATFYTHWIDRQAPSLLDKLCSSHILPLIHSEPMKELANSLVNHSNLASTLKSCSRFPESLPSVNATAVGGELIPIMASSSPFPLFTSIFRLLRIWKVKSSPIQTMNLKLPNSFFDYLGSLNRSPSDLSGNWFTRYELHFLHEFLMTCAEWGVFNPDQSKVAHQVALTVITSIGPGAEAIAVNWIRRLIFHPEFIQKGCDLETNLEKLHINETTHTLLSQTINELSQVAKFYSSHLFPEESTENSATKLTLEHRQLLPSDWIYLPLVVLYQRDLEKPLEANECVPETVLYLLQAVYVLLSLRPTWFFRIQPTEHYARLACTFMAGNDLFLEKSVCDYMWPILRKLAGQHLDFSKPVAGVDDFIDLYDRLVNQFEAVSYGSALFAAFILLPLQQQQPVRFRMKLWCEHSNVLRILTLNDEQMLDSLKHWKEPTETDEVLLMKYASSIRSGLITSERNSVLFNIATHHIKHYVERNPFALDKFGLLNLVE